MLPVVRIPFCTTFTQNSIFIKPATTTSSRVINGKVVIFKDKDNNNNLMYGKLVSIELHFCTFLYNWLLMRVCDDVIQITLLHFTTNNTDITLKIIKSRKKVAKLFGIPFLCCIFVVSERDNNNQIKNKAMTIREKYSKEIEVIRNLNKNQAYTVEETNITEYSIRTIYANNFVPSLCLEQIGGTIFTLYLAD